MAATVPAPYMAAQLGLAQGSVSLGGTIREGQAQLPGDHRLLWKMRNWQSIRQLAFVADVTLTGPGANLSGRIALRPNRVTLFELSGTAGWPLVKAVLPNVPFDCAAMATLLQASGTATRSDRALTAQASVPEGLCTRTSGEAVSHPALLLNVATGEAGILGRLTDAGGNELARLALTPDDRVRITVAQAGARLMPGMPASSDSQIDVPLALLFD